MEGDKQAAATAELAGMVREALEGETAFSRFIRTANEDEKREVYERVIDKVIAAQRAVLAEALGVSATCSAKSRAMAKLKGTK